MLSLRGVLDHYADIAICLREVTGADQCPHHWDGIYTYTYCFVAFFIVELLDGSSPDVPSSSTSSRPNCTDFLSNKKNSSADSALLCSLTGLCCIRPSLSPSLPWWVNDLLFTRTPFILLDTERLALRIRKDPRNPHWTHSKYAPAAWKKKARLEYAYI